MAAMEYDYDLLVLGSGPGGQKAAIAGAKLGRRVGICQGKTLPRGPFVMTLALALEPPGSPVVPTPDLTVPTVGALPSC